MDKAKLMQKFLDTFKAKETVPKLNRHQRRALNAQLKKALKAKK